MGAMLTLDLPRLRYEAIDIDASVATDSPLWEGSGLELARPLSIEGRAEGAGHGNVRVRGTFDTRVRAHCRRCLNELEVEVHEQFEMLFDPGISIAEEDFTLYTLDPEADELDLGLPIRERVQLQAPAYPVCSAECRGLCAQCGANLNAGDCGCTRVSGDPRWAPLLALRGDG